MKPPIIVTEPGDVMVFKSVREAEVCLEAHDVREGRLKAYDSEGRLLSVEAESEPEQRVFGITIVDPGIVKIGREESLVTHEGELRHVLVEFLTAIGVDAKSLEDATLESVLHRVIARQGSTV